MPNDVNNRIDRLRRNYRQDNNLDPARAVVASKAGVIYDPDIPGNVFVRVQTSNGLSGIRSVGGPTQTMYLYPGLNVKLGFDDRGQQFIDKVNTQAQFAANANANWTSQPPQPRVTQNQLETLAVMPTNPPSLMVSVKAWNPIVNGTYYEFPGTLVDFTGSLPASGSMFYAGIFDKSDYLTGEVFFSTPINVNDLPLDKSDVQQTINQRSTGSIPVQAIKLIGGQTQITLSDIQNDGKDLRQLVNTSDSGSSAFYQTIQGNGTPATQQSFIDFIDGTNTTVTVTNDGANTRTKVRIDASGGAATIEVAIYEEQQTSGTSGGTFTSGADQTRALNTEVSDIHNIASIASNQITVAATGTYKISWWAYAFRVDNHQSFLYNVTGATELKRGGSSVSVPSTDGNTSSSGAWIGSLTAGDAIELRHRCAATQATSGFGLAASFGTEVYSQVIIEKI